MTIFPTLVSLRSILLSMALLFSTAIGARAQSELPYDPLYVDLPVEGRMIGWIWQPVIRPTGQEFGQSVMPVPAQDGGLPGMMIRHNRADTIARGTYGLESLFYRGVPGRLPDSSIYTRIGLTDIGSDARLLCAGDWDADGYRDLAMFLQLVDDTTDGGWDYSFGRVVIFWGNAREDYSLADTSRLIIATELWGIARTATNKDIDGDGQQDLLIFGEAGMANGVPFETARLHLFRGCKGQRWGRNGVKRTSDWSLWNMRGYHLAVIDQDADGALDIVFHDDQSGRIASVSVMYGRHGGLPDTTDIETVELLLANGHYSLFSDITGDSVPELLVNTGSDEMIRIYAGAPSQRLKDLYGSGNDAPMPNRGFWSRPWAEVWLPNKLNIAWAPAGWTGLLDLGDVNHDGINDIWVYSEPNLICYLGGKYLDSKFDAIVPVPGSEFIAAANVGDITGTGSSMLAIGYDWIPHDYVNPFPGGVMFVRTDTSFVTSQFNPRRLPVTTSAVPVVAAEQSSVKLMVYPNPARERATAAWDTPLSAPARLSVINVLGEEVFSTDLDAGAEKADLDVRTLPAGSYRVMMRTATSIQSTAMMRY